ncbi:MAG: RidA family protein [Chitinophagaceae bacterium]
MKYLLLLLFVFPHLVFSQETPEQKLAAMNLQLPAVSKPMDNYVRYVQTGNLIFLAGHGPARRDGTQITGKLGKDISVAQGYDAAAVTALNLISTLKQAVGELSRVKRIVKVNGYVNSMSDFTDHPKVINGCSDLLVALFGEKGKHARAAMGMAALPNNIAVEIEMVVEVK